jgi:hypothetical protein
MTLAKTTANLIAALAMSCCFLPAAWGQTPAPSTAPAQKTAHKKKPTSAPAAAAKDAAPSQTAKPDAVAAKRDPFAPLVNEKKASGPPLPPGKAGLVIATVRVDGTVKAANGMLAVVTNPDERTYFLREGDRL